MDFREFFQSILLFLLLITKTNSENTEISGDKKVKLNLGDLVIEVTSPKGRENILNTEHFYDQWHSVDDITYWESIYGSMDNIPAFEDLPGISGETFILEDVKESDEDVPKSTKSLIKSEDRCEWVNPFYPQKKRTIREKREISIPEVKSEDSIRKPRTLSILHGKSGKLSRKFGIHSTRRSDFILNKLGRKNDRFFKTKHETRIYDRNPNNDIIDCGMPLKFVDSAIKGDESVNTRFESRDLSQVVANDARQLGQAKQNVIDLGLGGRQAIGLASLNNAGMDCSREGVNIAEGNIHGSIEVVGNSVLDTNSGIIIKDTRSVVEIQPSLAIESNGDAIDSVKTIVDTDIEQPEVVATNSNENHEQIVSDSKLELVDEDAVIGPILDESEIVGQPRVLPEDCSKEKNTNDHLEIVGAKLEEKNTEIVQEVEELPVIIKDNKLEAIEPIFDTEKSEAIEPIFDTEKTEAVEPISDTEKSEVIEPIFVAEKSEEIEPISDTEKSEKIEPISDTEKSVEIEPIFEPEKSEADEIVGTSLKINPTLNTKLSTDLNTNIEIGKKHHEKMPRHFRRVDLSCECFGPSEEFESGEFHPRKYQKFNDHNYHPGIHDKNFDHDSALHSGTKSSLNLHSNLDIGKSLHSGHTKSGIQTGLHTSLNTEINLNSNLGSKSLHASSGSALDLHSNLDIRISKNKGLHENSAIHKLSASNFDIDSNRQGNLHFGAESSLDQDSHLDISRSRPHQSRYRHDDPESIEDFYDMEESEENPTYDRKFPGNHHKNHPNKGRTRISGIDATSGIYSSLNTDLKANLQKGFHAKSDSRTLFDAGLHLNSDKSSRHSGRKNERKLNKAFENYGSSQSFEDSLEYDEYEEFYYGHPDFSRYRVKSDQNSRFGKLIDADINSGTDSRSGNHRLDSRSSLKQESDLESSNSEIKAKFREFTNPINSRFDDEIHTSNGQFSTGIKSSLDQDSHLDIAKGIIDENERSRIEAKVKKENGEFDEKICEADCSGIEDSKEDKMWPSSKFDDAQKERSEYYQREFMRFSGQGEAPYICDNCRKRLYEGMEYECPICGRFDQRPIKKQRQFLSSGTMYHFDGPKKHFKRTAENENTSSYNHHINFDANCTGDATSLSPECQAMNYDLQIPQDGNPVPLGFVRRHLSHGHDIAMDMHDRARSLVEGGLQPSPHTPSMLNLYNNKVHDELVKLNEESELTLVGTKLLQQKLSVDYNITPNTFLEFLNNNGFRVTGDRICQGRHKRCSGYNKFRSHDGSCNNIDHPTWGQSNRAFARILPARYSDGIHGMPVSVAGGELPNPRKLSVNLYSRRNNLDPELTLAVVQWGQTLAHDLARQVMDQTTKGGIECCGNNGKSQLPKSLQHHSCAPISISPRDKFYSSHGQRCMNFVRAMTVTREDCTLGPADQLNGATSFLDCSPVYGVDKSTSDELREFIGGRMKVEFRSGRWMLPTMRNRSNFCDIWTSDDVCYTSGDPRTNQNPQLVILQTLLVREHNRIANGLSALNPEWKDERIFQESRRIVIAEYQHITYNEWLPLLLGNRYCRRHGIIRTKPGMSNEYDELVNPSTIIGFTSGAFRSLHSMIDGDLGLCNVNGEIVDNLRLSDHYFRPRVIEENNNFEHLLRGLTMQRMQKQNMDLHRELTEYLFRSRNDYGMDLAAIDIQRGRDHGVPSYNDYRKICRLQPAQNFDDLSEEISRENIEKLRRVYADVDDIDLIVGATMENRISGSHFGPTNRCLIGEQFYRSRVGDRYFYDNKNSPYSFTPEQFDEITKVTLSRLMCDMGGAVTVVQRHAFRVISSKNPLVPCEDLPKLDLKYWID